MAKPANVQTIIISFRIILSTPHRGTLEARFITKIGRIRSHSFGRGLGAAPGSADLETHPGAGL
jgi:hypothetical protein